MFADEGLLPTYIEMQVSNKHLLAGNLSLKMIQKFQSLEVFDGNVLSLLMECFNFMF